MTIWSIRQIESVEVFPSSSVFFCEGRFGGGKVQAQPYIGLRPMWRFALRTFPRRLERRLSVRHSIGSKPGLSNEVKATMLSLVRPTTRAKDLSMNGPIRSMTTATSVSLNGRVSSIRSTRRVGFLSASGCGNAVEHREDQSTRPDQAQLARDFKIALPSELNADQRLALTKDFAEYMASKGMVVDVAIHAPHAHNDDRNYHVHMLLTMREIGPDGFGNKVRDWNKTLEFNRWMEKWSELGADHLERVGFHKEAERFRVGHLSRAGTWPSCAHERGDMEHFEQLLNEPQRLRGPEASGMEKKGRTTRFGDLNREIEERNRVRGLAREIREIYALASDPHAFAHTLEQKNMMLARITKWDARSSAAEFAIEPGEVCSASFAKTR